MIPALGALAAGLTFTALALLALMQWDLPLALSLSESWLGPFIQDWGRTPATALIIGAGYVVASTPRQPLPTRIASATLTHLVLHAALITNGLKLLVGRPRPNALTADAANFQAWHTLNPSLGDLSFPSGHVAITLILVPAILILWRTHRRLALALSACTALWALISAYGRMVHHAHFLTDVTASIGLGLAIAPLSVHLSDRLVGHLGARRAAQTQNTASE
jgi:membrane-associated phospholipid phosphatase